MNISHYRQTCFFTDLRKNRNALLNTSPLAPFNDVLFALSKLLLYTISTPHFLLISNKAELVSSAWDRDSTWHGPAIIFKGKSLPKT